MSSGVSSTAWSDQSTASQRVERPGIQRAPAPFFADQNNAFYEGVLRKLPVMLHVMDASGRILSASNRWLDAMGYELSEVAGRSLSELLPPEARTKLITTIYPKYLVTGVCEAEELIMSRKDGALITLSLSMSAFRGENGRLQKSACILRDVSDVKIASIAQSNTDGRYKSAFSQAVLGIALISPSGGIELANLALRRFLRRDDIEKMAVSFDDLVHRDDRGQFLNGIRQLLAGEIPTLNQDIRYITGDGTVVQGTTTASTVRGAKGETESLVIQVIDSTDRKMISGRQIQAEKLTAASEAFGAVAGQLESIAASLSRQWPQFEQILESFPAASVDRQVATQKLHELERLALKLKTIAGRQFIEAKDHALHEILGTYVDSIRASLPPNIELHIVKASAQPRVLVDSHKLQTSFSAIVENAVEAMPHGGQISIETETVYLDHDFCVHHVGVASGNYCVVAFSDTGVGIPANLIDDVLRPGITTRQSPAHSGLGLSAATGFIRQSGGLLTIHSEATKGTIVKIYLPRRMLTPEEEASFAAAHAAIVVPVSTDTATGSSHETVQIVVRKPKLLVVDDQEAVRAVACGFLEDFGYDVIEAGDGFEALAKLQEVDDIDLMFSDVVMPGGMNGFDLAQAAQSMKPHLKIVHTTGYPKGAMVHQDEPRFREGFIIMKPYRREDLQKIIKDALESQ
jgi:PAS domain S-box-containing protein